MAGPGIDVDKGGSDRPSCAASEGLVYDVGDLVALFIFMLLAAMTTADEPVDIVPSRSAGGSIHGDITVAATHADRPASSFWAEDAPFPVRENLNYPSGIVHRVLFRAFGPQKGPEVYRFLHDPVVAAHRGVLFAAWYNCPRAEMQEASVIRCIRSGDGGQTWSDPERVAWDRDNRRIMYVPAALASQGGRLYALVGNMKDGPDLVHDCEIFALNDADDCWKSLGFLGAPFLPNCVPRRMDDGNWIVGGRVAGEPGRVPTIPAVAISRGDMLTGPWTVRHFLPDRVFPGGGKPDCPETTLIIEGPDLTAVVRGPYGRNTAYLSFSRDYGRTWTAPEKCNLPMEPAKIHAGILSTGQRYVMYNLPTTSRRRVIALAVSRPGGKPFVKAWKIADDDERHQALKAKPEYAYPSAVEFDGHLYVVYSAMKRDCVMAIVPLASLAGGDP
jgi:hypothetical protein